MTRLPGWARALALFACGLALLTASAEDSGPSPATAPPVALLRIDGPIGPATADYVHRGLARAAREQAQLVVLQMDTPGGLDTAMRDIIKDVLAAPMPVAGFVAPRGARAASAGVYILLATHVAAMAPATNLGAATPVAIGLPSPGPDVEPSPRAASGASAPDTPKDTMAAKRINDAAAYIRALAQLRGRNADWAEQAVREAASLPADDALTRRVIDLVAIDTEDLLLRLNGRRVAIRGATTDAPAKLVKLATVNARVVAIEPNARERALAVIGSPSVALILLMIGFYGLLFEFMNPGMLAPGVIGALALLLALWALQMLPINYAGLALIVLGLAFFVAEAFVPSFGVLGLGGVAAFAFGALMLIDGETPGFGVPPALVGTLAVVSGVVVIGMASMAARAQRRPVVTGAATLIGATAEVVDVEVADSSQGWAVVDGERWRVRATGPMQPGQRVRITAVDGLTLDVSPQQGA